MQFLITFWHAVLAMLTSYFGLDGLKLSAPALIGLLAAKWSLIWPFIERFLQQPTFTAKQRAWVSLAASILTAFIFLVGNGLLSGMNLMLGAVAVLVVGAAVDVRFFDPTGISPKFEQFTTTITGWAIAQGGALGSAVSSGISGAIASLGSRNSGSSDVAPVAPVAPAAPVSTSPLLSKAVDRLLSVLNDGDLQQAARDTVAANPGQTLAVLLPQADAAARNIASQHLGDSAFIIDDAWLAPQVRAYVENRLRSFLTSAIAAQAPSAAPAAQAPPTAPVAPAPASDGTSLETPSVAFPAA